MEGLPVSFLNCDRPLHSGIRVPHLGLNECWLLDNRWLQDAHHIEFTDAPTML